MSSGGGSWERYIEDYDRIRKVMAEVFDGFELNVLAIADYSEQSGQPLTKHLIVEVTPSATRATLSS